MKYTLLLLFLFLQPFYTSAQALPISWEHCYGGDDYDDVAAICASGDDNYVFAGSTYSYDGDITSTMHGSADFLIMKINPSGGLIWQRTVGGPQLERAACIQHTADNGYILGGFTYSNSDDVSGNHGGSDAWIVKLNDTGAIQWQKCYGGSAFDNFYAITTSTGGGYLAIGATSSTDGDVTGFHGGTLADLWVVKLDDTGGIEWQKTLGGTMGDIGRSVIQASDGGYIIAGYTSSSDGDITINHGGVDCWIVKLNSSGILQWQKCYGGSYLDAALSICPATGGGYIFAGEAVSTDGDVSHFYGGDLYGGDVWVVRIDDTGMLLWEKSYGGSGNEIANSIHPAPGNKYIISGWAESHDGHVSGKKDTTDAWVLLTNDTGAIQWQKCLGGSLRERAYDAIQTPDSGFLIACVTSSSDSDVTYNHGLNDCWMVKLGNPPVVAIPGVNSYTTQLYPNPSGGQFVLQGTASTTSVRVEIADCLGRRIYSDSYSTMPNGQYAVTVNLTCANGLYFVRVISGNYTTTLPLVIQ